VLVKFVSFALVGVVGTLAHYLVLYVLVEIQGFDPVTASACGAFAGLLANYGLNFKWTFNSGQSHSQTFPKFASIAVFGMGLNVVLMTFLTQRFYYLYAQLFTTALVLIWNFLANFLWTFKMDKTAHASHTPLAAMLKKPFTVFGLIFTILFLRVITLSLYPLYDPSESRYAEMARKMWETQNWVTPMIDYGVPFWGKPPLTIWLTSVGLGIGGINDFSARAPSLLLGIGIG
jgi:putative flippase GtrA